MNAQHTPGPWQIAQYSSEAEIFYRQVDTYGTEYGAPVVVAVVTSRRHDDPMGNADARLIAAAPELLAACQELIAMVDEMLPKAGPCGWGTIATDNARAAIAKATAQ